MLHLRLAPMLAATAVVAVAAPATASAAPWAPVATPPGGTFISGPVLAVAPDGRAVVAWEIYATGVVMESERPSGGTWSAPVTVGSGATQDPAVVATDADTTITWRTATTSYVASAPAGAAFATPWNVGVPAPVTLDTSPDGWTLATWTQAGTGPTTGAVAAAIRPPGGSFGATTTFPSVSAPAAPIAAIGTGGRAVVAWVAGNGSSQSTVLDAMRDPATGQWSAPETATAAPGGQWQPSLGLEPSGDVILAWNAPNQGRGTTTVDVAVRHAGSWGPARTVGYGNDANLAVGADGTAALEWSDTKILRIARRPDGGTFGPPATPPGACYVSGDPLPVRVDGDGDAVVTWPALSATPATSTAILDAQGVLHKLPDITSPPLPYPVGAGIDTAGTLTVLLSGGSSLATTAPVATLAQQLPAVSGADCALPSGSRPVVARPVPKATAPALRFAKAPALRRVGARLRVPVRCPAGPAPCTGTLTVRALGRRIATTALTVPAGASRTLSVPFARRLRTRTVQLLATTTLAGAVSVRTAATAHVRR